MNMQDKDMDELFRSKLDEYEVEPSANVWANINRELGTTGRRRGYGPLLRIAASIVVMIGAGLFFWHKQQVIVSPKKPEVAVVINHHLTDEQSTRQQSNIATTVNTIAKTQQVTKSHAQLAVIKRPTTVKNGVVTNITNIQIGINATPQVQQTKPSVVNDEQPILANTDTKPMINKPVVPETPLINKTEPNSNQELNKPIMASVNKSDIEKPNNKKHKIHGLGGFLNAVVGVIDKRQDKIIEFTDTDEGDSITGINLGIIKVKKQ